MDYKQLYLSPEGRIGRQTYWMKLIVPALIISLVLPYLDLALGTVYMVETAPGQPEAGFGLLSTIFSLLVIVPSIMMGIKRFHDRDKSGWWILIGFIPIIGWIWLLIELGFLKGTEGPNRFGPPEGEEGSRAYRADAAM